MTLGKPPYGPAFLNSELSDAEVDRMLIAMWAGHAGVQDWDTCKVTAASGRNVSVAPGPIAIDGSGQASTAGFYVGWVRTATTVPVNPNPSGSNRTTLVVAWLKDTEYSMGDDDWGITTVDGAAVGGSPPPDPASIPYTIYYVLAALTVPAGFTQGSELTIIDRRSTWGLGPRSNPWIARVFLSSATGISLASGTHGFNLDSNSGTGGYDPSGMLYGGALTIKKKGRYTVRWRISYVSGASGQRVMTYVAVNGSERIRGEDKTSSATNTTSNKGEGTILCEKDDVVALGFTNFAGVAISLDTSGPAHALHFLECDYVGP